MRKAAKSEVPSGKSFRACPVICYFKIFLFYILLTSRIPRFFFLDLSELKAKNSVPPKPYKHLGTAENCYIVINRRCFLVGGRFAPNRIRTTVDSLGGASGNKGNLLQIRREEKNQKRPRTPPWRTVRRNRVPTQRFVFLSLLGLER